MVFSLFLNVLILVSLSFQDIGASEKYESMVPFKGEKPELLTCTVIPRPANFNLIKDPERPSPYFSPIVLIYNYEDLRNKKKVSLENTSVAMEEEREKKASTEEVFNLKLFFHALYYNKLSKARELMPLIKDLNVRNDDGFSILEYCCHNRSDVIDIGFMRDVIQRGARLDTYDQDGYTLLANTCSIESNKKRALKLTRFLIKEGADVNQKSKDQSTALHWAVFHRQHDCIDVLLKAGADPYSVGEDGYTAIHHAAWSMWSVFKKFIPEIEKMEPIEKFFAFRESVADFFIDSMVADYFNEKNAKEFMRSESRSWTFGSHTKSLSCEMNDDN